MAQVEDKVWVALHEDMAFVRVQGRASFKVSTALKRFGSVAVDARCKAMLFDMSQCVGLDSTFMGVLAGIATRLNEENGGRMILVNMSPRTRGLVATLGLDHVVSAYETGATPEQYAGALAQSQRMSVLEVGSESMRATAETMLMAHEELTHLSPDNLPRFKDVLAFLREDLKKAESPPGGA
jgi:anti-sigma B factor antagonist